MNRRRAAWVCPISPTKTAYRTEIAARLALAKIAAHGKERRRGFPVACYRCKCGRWHLTSRSR